MVYQMLELFNFTSVSRNPQSPAVILKEILGTLLPVLHRQIPENQLQLRTPPGTADMHKDFPASPQDKRFKGGQP